MANKEFPLSLLIKAVDQATEPLRRINKQIKDFTAPVRKLNNSFRALAAEAGIPKIGQSFRAVGTAIGRVGQEAWALGRRIAFMAVGAGVALYGVMRSAIEAGDQLDVMAERTGLSVDAFAQLQYAARQADVEQEDFSRAMDQFNRRLGQARAGTGPLLAFLKRVSPAFAQQVKESKNAEQALGLVTKAFEKVSDPAERAALANALFGKGGAQMAVFLHQGTAAIDEQRQRYSELVGSQEEFARSAAELDDKIIPDMNAAFGGLRNSIMVGLFPAFRDLAHELTKFLVANRAGIAKWAKEAGAAISSWVRGGGIGRLVDGLRSVADSARRFVDAIGGVKGIAVIAGAILGGKLLIAVTSLGLALKGLVVAVAGAAAVLGAAAAPFLLAAVGIGLAAYQIVKYWKPLKQFFVDLWAEIVRIFEYSAAKIGSVTDKMSSIADTIRGVVDPFGEEQSGKVLSRRPVLGAAKIIGAGKQPTGGEAHITVDFNNLPRGTRVSGDSADTAAVDLNRGYSLVTP